MAVSLFSVRSSTHAAISTFCSLIFTAIAFTTPYWLRNEKGKHFENLGLWEACFIHLRDRYFNYDKEFHGCHWLFDEDYAFLRKELLEPPFFIATQVLYSFGFTILLLTVVFTLVIELCMIIDRESMVMRMLASAMFFSGIFCTMAVIIFGIRGDDRDWMPDPESNYLSWSFAFAVVGCFFTWTSAVLFFVEARQLDKQKRKRRRQPNGHFFDHVRS